MKRKKVKKKKGRILVLLLLGFAAAALLWQGMRLRQAPQQVEVDTVAVARGYIQTYAEGNGSIAPAQKESFTLPCTLQVLKVLVEEGDLLTAGDPLATLDPSSIQQGISSLEQELDSLNTSISNMTKGGSSSLTSPVSGRVKRIYVKEGDLLTDTCARYGGVFELGVDERMKVTAEVTSPELFHLGDTFDISLDGYSTEGTVVEKKGSQVTLTFPDNASYPVGTETHIVRNSIIMGTGISMSNAPYLVDAAYGTCSSLTVSEGDWVYNGSVLLYREDYAYNNEFLTAVEKREEKQKKLQFLKKLWEDPCLYAEGEGILSDLALLDNTTVSEGKAAYSLISTGTYRMKVEIDELDIGSIHPGQKAEITFDAFDDETIEGVVEKVSALGSSSGGVTTYPVTLALRGEERIRIGMNATAKIITDNREDALLVPIDAISLKDSQHIVRILEGDTLTDAAVTLGLVSNTTAEILEGLAEGTQVVLDDGMQSPSFPFLGRRQGR